MCCKCFGEKNQEEMCNFNYLNMHILCVNSIYVLVIHFFATTLLAFVAIFCSLQVFLLLYFICFVFNLLYHILQRYIRSNAQNPPPLLPLIHFFTTFRCRKTFAPLFLAAFPLWHYNLTTWPPLPFHIYGFLPPLQTFCVIPLLKLENSALICVRMRMRNS